MVEVKTRAILTCPKCGKEQNVEMPTDACQHFYKCIYCGEMLKPKEGDVVFSAPIPIQNVLPKQEEALMKQ